MVVIGEVVGEVVRCVDLDFSPNVWCVWLGGAAMQVAK